MSGKSGHDVCISSPSTLLTGEELRDRATEHLPLELADCTDSYIHEWPDLWLQSKSLLDIKDRARYEAATKFAELIFERLKSDDEHLEYAALIPFLSPDSRSTMVDRLKCRLSDHKYPVDLDYYPMDISSILASVFPVLNPSQSAEVCAAIIERDASSIGNLAFSLGSIKQSYLLDKIFLSAWNKHDDSSLLRTTLVLRFFQHWPEPRQRMIVKALGYSTSTTEDADIERFAKALDPLLDGLLRHRELKSEGIFSLDDVELLYVTISKLTTVIPGALEMLCSRAVFTHYRELLGKGLKELLGIISRPSVLHDPLFPSPYQVMAMDILLSRRGELSPGERKQCMEAFDLLYYPVAMVTKHTKWLKDYPPRGLLNFPHPVHDISGVGMTLQVTRTILDMMSKDTFEGRKGTWSTITRSCLTRYTAGASCPINPSLDYLLLHQNLYFSAPEAFQEEYKKIIDIPYDRDERKMLLQLSVLPAISKAGNFLDRLKSLYEDIGFPGRRSSRRFWRKYFFITGGLIRWLSSPHLELWKGFVCHLIEAMPPDPENVWFLMQGMSIGLGVVPSISLFERMCRRQISYT